MDRIFQLKDRDRERLYSIYGDYLLSFDLRADQYFDILFFDDEVCASVFMRRCSIRYDENAIYISAMDASAVFRIEHSEIEYCETGDDDFKLKVRNRRIFFIIEPRTKEE